MHDTGLAQRRADGALAIRLDDVGCAAPEVPVLWLKGEHRRRFAGHIPDLVDHQMVQELGDLLHGQLGDVARLVIGRLEGAVVLLHDHRRDAQTGGLAIDHLTLDLAIELKDRDRTDRGNGQRDQTDGQQRCARRQT